MLEVPKMVDKEAASIVVRLYIHFLRIAMVLEIISYEDKEEIPSVIWCSDTNLKIAFQLIKQLKVCSFEAYAYIKSTGNSKGFTEVVWTYYEALADEFNWAEAKVGSQQIGDP